MNTGCIEFSLDGKYLALCDPLNSLINIYQVYTDEVVEVSELKKSLQNGKNLISFNGKESQLNLGFIEKIKFDKFNKYLIGFGGNQIFILDIENQVGEILSVKKSIFE